MSFRSNLLDNLVSLYIIGIQMKPDRSRLRQELRRLEESRATYLASILGARGPLRRGAFVTVRRKCGKPNCRCARGEGHPAKYLSVKEGGRTRMIYVPSSQEVQVAKEAEQYRRYRQARAMLAKLSHQALAVIDELEHALQATQKIGGRKKKRRSDSDKMGRKAK